MTPSDPGRPDEQPVIRDKRRIDPSTGEVRPAPGSPADSAEPGVDATTDALAAELETELSGLEAGLAADLVDLRAELAERTADVQRVHAEYANYRKRVERDREAVREQAVAGALGELLPVLDDIGRAREHGDLDGAFKLVGEALEAAVAKAGLERFGVPGDPFDPNLHEALMHETAADITEPTCITVFRPGYRMGERLVRPAQVVVADPQ